MMEHKNKEIVSITVLEAKDGERLASTMKKNQMKDCNVLSMKDVEDTKSYPGIRIIPSALPPPRLEPGISP